jgi:hypothetical protein
MATVHIPVDGIAENWPEAINGHAIMTNIDCQVDGKWVRMGYPSSELTDSATVQSKLESDSSVLLNAEKQHSDRSELGGTPQGTDRSDLVPDDFNI